MEASERTTIYHEIDFLLPAQRFNINFSYVSQRGLPFVREFVLRLVHLGPMSTSQVASFLGFSRLEAQEAIRDLVERGELELSESGRLTLTEKSRDYFTDIGEVPSLSMLRDGTAHLSFELATFSCLGAGNSHEKWRAGIALHVADENASCSEILVEKHFQRQFNDILRNGFLSKAVVQDGRDPPSAYTVNSVKKIKHMPLRLPVEFKLDEQGRNVEREDFDCLESSDYVHGQVSLELDRLARPGNFVEIAKAMLEVGDTDTFKAFESSGNTIDFQFFDDLTKLESNGHGKRTTFIGPLYAERNWSLVQKQLGPIIKKRRESKQEVGETPVLWVAPSDPYWGKSSNLLSRVGELVEVSSTKNKRIYSPTIFVPVSGRDNNKSAHRWKMEFEPGTERLRALVEGFLGGGVEVLHFEGEFVVVVYHLSLPQSYPVSLPIGFISTDKAVVTKIGRLANAYVGSSSGFDLPNDCGPLDRL